MKKFPFNAVGFKELQQELQLLTNLELANEAEQIKNTFQDWMQLRFELNSTQVEYLWRIDQRAIVFIADQTSFAVGNRLPVLLEKEEAPATDEQGKIIYHKSSLTVVDGGSDGFVASGQLTIGIRYQA